ncbi:MAG: 50S ribosomal protein L11 methyltransferase [Alphaproteobacteria bacterium]|nr:50S ribosomal protein L11 methyltransferase [Alphaproteobacteria bacterium]MBQ9235288.1 50S ribosomal protein L11 methyltransferase [Alphaproteobacteria bacterium]
MQTRCWQVTFSPQPAITAPMQEFLDEFFAVNAIDYTPDGQEQGIGYAQDGNFSEQAMLAFAQSKSLKLPSYQISLLKSENWLKDYVIKFAPFTTGDFCIYGIHQTTPPQTSLQTLQIYAATAFGSDHQTTRACISAICELYHQGADVSTVLDMGCGSGILSLCAGKLWPQSRILAADIDAEAVVVTLNNAAHNGLTDNITVLQSDGYKTPQISQQAPYNLILSNILANPLKEFAPALTAALSPLGYCVLSGFVDNQVDEVIAAHTACGLKLLKIYSFDNWRAALLQKA